MPVVPRGRHGRLRRHRHLVVGDVGLEIVRAILKLDVNPHPKLLDVERRCHTRSMPIRSPAARASAAVNESYRPRDEGYAQRASALGLPSFASVHLVTLQTPGQDENQAPRRRARTRLLRPTRRASAKRRTGRLQIVEAVA